MASPWRLSRWQEGLWYLEQRVQALHSSSVSDKEEVRAEYVRLVVRPTLMWPVLQPCPARYERDHMILHLLGSVFRCNSFGGSSMDTRAIGPKMELAGCTFPQNLSPPSLEFKCVETLLLRASPMKSLQSKCSNLSASALYTKMQTQIRVVSYAPCRISYGNAAAMAEISLLPIFYIEWAIRAEIICSTLLGTRDDIVDFWLQFNQHWVLMCSIFGCVFSFLCSTPLLLRSVTCLPGTALSSQTSAHAVRKNRSCIWKVVCEVNRG